jgi:predicted membrane metal-binding protein
MSNTEVNTSGWAGWGVFAAVVLIVAGTIDAFHGLQALIGPDTAYFLANVGLFSIDVQGWGWWHLIAGALLILVGIFLLRGAKWARITAIVLVAINAVGQLSLISVQPWLSLALLAIDVVVIYALTVHGREIDAKRA